MKSFSTIFTILIALFIGNNCGNGSTGPDNNLLVLPRQLAKSEIELIHSGTAFGLNIFRTMVSQQADSNIIVSPLSVSMALGMTYSGAAGETQSAMHEVLAYQQADEDAINQSYLSILELLTGLDPLVSFQIANSIWYREDFAVLDSFIQTNQDYFHAVVQALDFSQDSAVDAINAWVCEQTHGKIEDIIEGPIHPLTVMFLINAIYFQSSWTYEFDQTATRKEQFHPVSEESLTCQMMHITSEFDYFENADFQAVDLPYGDGYYSMTILLPKSGIDLDDIIGSMHVTEWESWTASFEKDTVALSLPKFKLRYFRKLNDALIQMGMGVAFGGSADFSCLCPGGGIFIQEVRHKTFIQVDEEGTEAAAATSVEIREKCNMNGDSGPIPMRVDHPFLFAIRERNSGTLLFIGKIYKPKWEDE